MQYETYDTTPYLFENYNFFNFSCITIIRLVATAQMLRQFGQINFIFIQTKMAGFTTTPRLDFMRIKQYFNPMMILCYVANPFFRHTLSIYPMSTNVRNLYVCKTIKIVASNNTLFFQCQGAAICN